MEIMDERLGHVIKQIPALLFAGRLDTPEPFQPTIAPVAPRSLSHFAIKDDLSWERKNRRERLLKLKTIFGKSETKEKTNE